VTFEARPGESIAILGPTGSGKTTLLSLITRFYDPQRGRVLVDGTDVRKLNLDDLRRNVGLVFQESFLFSNTVAANIAFGHPDATREEIERAAKIAAAHEFIVNLPKGYDTLLAKAARICRAASASGSPLRGRCCSIPRSCCSTTRRRQSIPRRRRKFWKRFENAMRGRTTFMVANRISSLRRADRIIVLEDGRIVQVGTHEELVRADGPYRRTAELQFATS